MSDKPKDKLPAPQVQVIRKPGGVVPVRPSTTAVSPKPTSRPLAPRPVPVPAPRPAATTRQPYTPQAPAAPRPPPSPEAIAALAKKERVPNRIAKGELEGKMKCRIWKKLHAEEAKRFDQAWTLAEATPGLDLADAFGVVQGGMSVEEYRARRARTQRREAIKEARAVVSAEAIDAFVAARLESKGELAFVMGERTVLDILTGVAPVSFTGERSGQLEKLQLVILTRRTTWEHLQPTLERDSKLAQKPTSVARQPSRRPVSDPRSFLPHVGQQVSAVLRNGIKLQMPLLAVGPFDVLLGTAGDELFVPLHAMLSWKAIAADGTTAEE